MSWLLTAFLFAAAAGLPLHGKLGDVIGRRAALVLAALLFTAGSVLAGRAHTMGELTAFRALQGAGAGDWWSASRRFSRGWFRREYGAGPWG
ncbi:hypothetical protein SRIMM317S_00589 [Streptomyces rimosus subsp. rimosus]